MIKLTLTTNLPQEAKNSKQKIKVLRCIFFFLSFVYIFILNSYYLLIHYKPDIETKFLNPFFIGVRFFKVMMDFYIEILFIILLAFFIKFRKENAAKHNFSVYNCLVFITILFLYLLNLFQSVLIFAWTYD